MFSERHHYIYCYEVTRVWTLPSFVQFGIMNDEVQGVGNAEEEVGWEKYIKAPSCVNNWVKIWQFHFLCFLFVN